ncbi:MAG TPA: hypothetical protein VMV47_08180 [Bacteroidales bacterium]|nr:hypothetical protein [Bacteroidales bacterium]
MRLKKTTVCNILIYLLSDNYGGQHIRKDFFILIPKGWKAQPDTVFPPERTRTMSAHEMAHEFVYQINPAVNGWVTEGIAKFEETAVFNEQIRKAGFTWGIGNTIKEGKGPKFSELISVKKITSSSMGLDYLFAATFFDFASTNYEYKSIVEFIISNNFNSLFEKSENMIWKKWGQFLNLKYY